MGSLAMIFSVVIPTHNRPLSLARCLQALAAQEYPAARFEVIVVDDGSVPPATVPDEMPFSLRVLRQPQAGPAAARNHGAAAARGRYLAFLDDDCRPNPGWLDGFARQFARTPQALLGGRTTNGRPDNAYAAASQLLVNALTGGDVARALHFFPANNMALSADRFDQLDGFDPRYRRAAGEDRDFCRRWRARGWSLQRAPEARVAHEPHLTLKRYWRQHANYGRGAYLFHRGTGQGDTQPFYSPTRYLRLLLAPFAADTARSPWKLSLLLVLAQLATGAGYTQEALRRRAVGREFLATRSG